MVRKEIVILRSSFQTDDFVWEEYGSLIGRLTIDNDAHFTIVCDSNFEQRLARIGSVDSVMIATGGVEGLFVKLLPRLQGDISIIADGRNNSLAAALECLTYLAGADRTGKIVHNLTDLIALPQSGCRCRCGSAANGEPSTDVTSTDEAVDRSAFVGAAVDNPLSGSRILLFGEPSDWLVASGIDSDLLRSKWGVESVMISLEELIDAAARVDDNAVDELVEKFEGVQRKEPSADDLRRSMRLLAALQSMCEQQRACALTIRCFDILKLSSATGCLALSLLNDQGIVAGCEGDMQALMSMLLVRKLLGSVSFMANPSLCTNRLVRFAHCTIPLSMCGDYTLRSHFESSIGAAVEGRLKSDRYTLFKWGGERLDRFYAASFDSVESPHSEHLCRTQLSLSADIGDYLLNRPIGNHHILIEGDHCDAICKFMDNNNIKRII